MSNTIYFILTNFLTLGVFYSFYHFTMKNLTHFTFNRSYLLSALILSLIIPFVHHFLNLSFLSNMNYGLVSINNFGLIPFGNNEMMGVEFSHESYSSFSTEKIVLLIYLAGCLFMLYRFIVDIFSVIKLIRSSEIIKKDNWNLIFLQNSIPSFSFFKYIFIQKNDLRRSEGDVDQILRHELIHVNYKHSYDIIFIELLTIIFWFNPFMYLYKRSIKQMHEFHADSEASGFYGTKNYAMLLVSMAASQQTFSLVSDFSKKQLKQRIMMLNTLKSKKMTKLRYLFFIPLFGLITIVACNIAPIDEQEIEKATALKENSVLNSMPSIFPINRVEGVEISAGFGEMINPITKKKVFHKAIDIKAPEGTSIFATADGIVIKSEKSEKGYGNVIVIEHANNYSTVYAHMKDLIVKEGALVKKGEKIGTVGSTGMSTGPHLHYEVRKDDENLDPLNFFVNISE